MRGDSEWQTEQKWSGHFTPAARPHVPASCRVSHDASLPFEPIGFCAGTFCHETDQGRLNIKQETELGTKGRCRSVSHVHSLDTILERPGQHSPHPGPHTQWHPPSEGAQSGRIGWNSGRSLHTQFTRQQKTTGTHGGASLGSHQTYPHIYTLQNRIPRRNMLRPTGRRYHKDAYNFSFSSRRSSSMHAQSSLSALLILVSVPSLSCLIRHSTLCFFFVSERF
jgi:hypothetical protein